MKSSKSARLEELRSAGELKRSNGNSVSYKRILDNKIRMPLKLVSAYWC